jgi:hypothetical protein
MKKLFLLLVVLFATASISEAQIASGKYMIGGTAGFQSAPSTWQLNQSVGYFVTDDFGLGIDLNMRGSGFMMDLGIAGRKYWSILDNTYLYGHAGVSVGVVGTTSFNIQLYPGVMYFFNERVAIDGRLNGLQGGGIGMSLLF